MQDDFPYRYMTDKTWLDVPKNLPYLPLADPADDGPEIAVIRAFTERTAEWYRMQITAARVAHEAEEWNTFNVENEFARKVGSL